MKNSGWVKWAKELKGNLSTLSVAMRHPDVPLASKVVIALVVWYALSPIDLIPDFIPVVGYLDDLILVPLGIWLAVRLIPTEVWKDCQNLAARREGNLPRSRCGVVVVILIWILIALAVAYVAFLLT